MKVRRQDNGELVACIAELFTGDRPWPSGVEGAPDGTDDLWFMEIDGPVTIKPGDWIFRYTNGESWHKSAATVAECYELVGDMEPL